MHFTFTNHRVLILALALILATGPELPGQEYVVNNSESTILQTVAPQRSWQVKVIWEDARGIRHKTRGWLMLVMHDAILVAPESAGGRARQEKIYAHNILKLKYKERGAPTPLPDIAVGAVQGIVSGGYVPVQTGNIYLDLLAGAVQGAIGGIFSGNSYSRSVNVAQRPDYYRNYVYPDLAGGR